MPTRALGTALISLLVAFQAQAEIYRWTDSDGKLHFTSDLTKVPREHRSAARERSSAPATERVQTYRSALEPASPSHASSRSGETLRIPFERRGSLMWVEATVNDRRRVPFLIDTGASGVSLPAGIVAELGIPITADTPRVMVATANGTLSVPLVEIDSVQLGGARVERLNATVNPSLDVGLLGGSFFNNFRYSVDMAASVITLEANDSVRGGAAADQWRSRFQALRASIERLEDYLATREISRKNRELELEGNLASMRDRLQDLEIEANHAGVPQAWRR